MNVPFLNLTRQYDKFKDELEANVMEVMRSGLYIGGKYVKEFEENMSNYLGAKHVVSCANGTDALVLALRASNIKTGDEVITTPFTFFATAEAIAEVGAIPVFVDVNEEDFCIDASKIEEKITARTKAILPVHIFGNPCDLDNIKRIADSYGLSVIEDAAQAIGSEYRGEKIGKTSGMACFSFYPTKNLGAFGDAGMITTDDDNLAVTLLALREHGMSANGAKAREILYGIKEDSFSETASSGLYNPYKYFNYIIGYNSRLDAMQAAILSVKLKKLDEMNCRRAQIAAVYTEQLSKYVKTPVCLVDKKTCYHQYAIRTEKKHEMGDYLSSMNIGTAAFYPIPLHLQKAFEYLNYNKGSFPVAETLAQETVCLPIFPELTDSEVEYVSRAVIDFLEGEQQ